MHSHPTSNSTPAPVRVGVLGASGYSGRELCALVLGHPGLSLAFATANSQRGTTLRVRAGGRTHDVPLVGPDEADLAGVALVFCALPHGASAEWAAKAVAAGARVVDLSSDLRPGFGGASQGPAGLPGDAPYGRPERVRPGCRATRRTDCRSCSAPPCAARAWWRTPGATRPACSSRWRRWRAPD